MAKPLSIPVHDGFQTLKRLTVTQLGKLSEDEKAALRDDYLDLFDEIHDNALMRKWSLCLLIRDTFAGNKIQMGRFLQELRENKPNAEMSRIAMSTFSNFCQAALFCERFGITDVYHCGLYPSVIYLITQPKNAAIVDRLYHKLKHKSYPVEEVRRFIEQERAVATIYPEQEPEDEDILFEPPEPREKRLIPVQNNIAMDPGKGDDTSAPIGFAQGESLSASRTAYTNVDLFAEPAFQAAPDQPPASYVGPTLVPAYSGGDRRELSTGFVDLSTISDADLLLELASRKAYSLSDTEILTELQLLSERYGKSPLKKIPLLQLWIDIEKALIYGRKTG